MEGTIQAIAGIVEARDPYTAGHQHRVAALAVAMAREMGLPEAQIEGIKVAGVIHDLGKINVPAEILSKPGRLSEAEFDLLKGHPLAGHDILKDIDFPWPIAETLLQHHERLDGSGYPGGLKENAILIEAKNSRRCRCGGGDDLSSPLSPCPRPRGGIGGDRAGRGAALRHCRRPGLFEAVPRARLHVRLTPRRRRKAFFARFCASNQSVIVTLFHPRLFEQKQILAGRWARIR